MSPELDSITMEDISNLCEVVVGKAMQKGIQKSLDELHKAIAT